MVVSISLFVYVVLLTSCAVSPPDDDLPVMHVLHRVSLQGDREIVVQKGPVTSTSALQDLLPKRVTDSTQDFFDLSVVLHSKSAPSLTLWSQCYPLYRDSDYGEYAVLDVLLLSNRVVFVLAGASSSISVFDVGVCGPARSTGLRGVDWSLLGAAIPASPGRLAAELGYDETTRRVSLVVTDRLQGHEKRTRFMQKDEGWEFESAEPQRFVPD